MIVWALAAAFAVATVLVFIAKQGHSTPVNVAPPSPAPTSSAQPVLQVQSIDSTLWPKRLAALAIMAAILVFLFSKLVVEQPQGWVGSAIGKVKEFVTTTKLSMDAGASFHHEMTRCHQPSVVEYEAFVEKYRAVYPNDPVVWHVYMREGDTWGPFKVYGPAYLSAPDTWVTTWKRGQETPVYSSRFKWEPIPYSDYLKISAQKQGEVVFAVCGRSANSCRGQDRWLLPACK